MTLFRKTPTTLRRGAKTLPGHYYTSADLYAQETERIFYQRWVLVGRESEIANTGDYMLRQVGTESLILVRDRKGEIHGFYNLCRHRGTQLCTETSGHFAATIRCPYHAWGYGLDGTLVSAPFMQTVEGFRLEDFPLVNVAIARWEGFIFVNLAEQPIPFEQAIAPLLGKFGDWQLPTLQVGHRIEYNLAANWKIILQNYSECYHCPVAHPELAKLSSAGSAANDLYRGSILGGPMSIDAPYTSLSIHGQRTLPTLGTVANEDLQRAYYYLLFPTMLLSLQPDFVMVHRLEAIAPHQTRVTCEWLFAPTAIAQPSFDPSPMVELWDLVNRQDWKLCESMQIGVSSRAYQPGFYAGQESLLAEIDREVLQALGHLQPSSSD
ncbi:aromatic ring-hydroxylating oxygenase subunit alpha [Leptolyngbya sp. AN02str]|uniref:aromatic ring-hydroxylating oxygenase subunit alpha n=1 Tax=Leptolyngbya sp. AN02str TaxID=3423363 RepID=UPI003D31FB73